MEKLHGCNIWNFDILLSVTTHVKEFAVCRFFVAMDGHDQIYHIDYRPAKDVVVVVINYVWPTGPAQYPGTLHRRRNYP